MTELATMDRPALASTSAASRRSWLKSVGALLGTGLLAAPAAAAALAGGDEYIGMVKLLAGTTPPVGWARCDGRVLPVAGHPALFAVLGAAYGGDGAHTFALPNLGEPAADGITMQFAIKTANGPATTTALAELRLVHQRRPRARRA